MVELYLKSCILVELCIGRVLFGRDVNMPIPRSRVDMGCAEGSWHGCMCSFKENGVSAEYSEGRYFDSDNVAVLITYRTILLIFVSNKIKY